MLPTPPNTILTTSLRDVLQHMPLFERLQALASIMGERIRPAMYVATGDAGAVGQNTAFKPQSNEGPFVIHDIRSPITGTATDSTVYVNLKANGVTYWNDVRGAAIPTSLNSPIVIEESNQALLKTVARAGAHGTIRAYASGYHCSERFARTVRGLGEMWADELQFAVNDQAKALRMTHETMLEAIFANATITSLAIRAHEVNLMPSGLDNITGMFSQVRGFGRGGNLYSAVNGLTGRCQLMLPRSSSIIVRTVVTATSYFTFLGRRRWIEAA